MKVASVILSVVAVLMLAMIACFFIGGTIAVDVDIQVVEVDALEAMQSALDDASESVMLDITMNLKNRGFLDVEWLRAELVLTARDVAVNSLSTKKLDIAANSSGELNLKVLVHAEDVELDGRAIFIEYYVFGMRRTAKISC